MNVIQFVINKALVLDEVAKTTSYAGAKAIEDNETKGQAYERIFATDADREMMERFWLESCSAASDSLRPWIIKEKPQMATRANTLANNYEATLAMPDNWNPRLLDSLRVSMFAYFANSILSKWMQLTNKEDAEMYGATAVAMMKDVELKLYDRVRPIRPVYNQPPGEVPGGGDVIPPDEDDISAER